MGAQQFEQTAAAPTCKEAFDNLYQEAIYQHGHNPYSGTIATMDGFLEFEPPPYTGAIKWLEWVKYPEKAPGKHQQQAQKLHKIYNRKRGRCIALKMNDQERREYKKKINTTKHVDAWIFCGWAAS